MKIATYNVNGINARLPVLLQWLDSSRPDIVCLQELKASQEKFPFVAIRAAGYHAVWHGEKSWNGVAILGREFEPEGVVRGLPGDPDDFQSRYLEATVGTTRVACIYLPNGNPAPGPKFDYKLRWFDRLVAHAAGLVRAGDPVVVAGDYNVIPTEFDVRRPERWAEDALFRPEVRKAFGRLLDQGWTDSIRCVHPSDRIYTFWEYRRGAWGRDEGLRIDHLLVNAAAARCLLGAGVDRVVRGWEKTSDHAPVWIEFEAQ